MIINKCVIIIRRSQLTVKILRPWQPGILGDKCSACDTTNALESTAPPSPTTLPARG